MSSYKRFYGAEDKHGLVHFAWAYRVAGEWHYEPWCDSRRDVATSLETKKVDRRLRPLSCFECIKLARECV